MGLVLTGTLRLIAGLAAFVFVVPACAAVTVHVIDQLHGWPRNGPALIGGAAVAAALVWWRKPNWLIHTTIHELCHALFCLALGVRIRAFQTTDGDGGAVVHRKVDPIRTTLIALAPYVWPLVLVPLLAVRWVVTDDDWPRAVVSALCGFVTVHHLHGLYHNIRLNFWGRQADLTRAGKVLSIAIIISAHCLWAAVWLLAVYR